MKSGPQNKKESHRDGEAFLKLLRIAGIQPARFLVPVLFAMGTAVFEGISLGLLMPLAKGVLEGDYHFLEHGPLPFRHVMNMHLAQGRPNATAFVALILVIITAALLKNCFQYLSGLSLDHTIFTFYGRLQQALFRKCISLKKAFFDQSSQGVLTNLILSQTFEIVTAVKIANRHLTGILLIIPYLTLLLIISWRLALISLVAFPALYLAITWLVARIRDSSRASAQLQNELGKRLSNVLMALPLIKAYSMENHESDHFTELSERTARARFNIEKKSGLIPAIQEMLTIIVFLFLICIMAFFYKRGYETEIAGLLVFFLILRRALNSVSSIGSLKSVMARIHGPLQHLATFFDQTSVDFVENGGQRPLSGLSREISFDKVSFAYQKDVVVLKDLNLRLEKGKVTAIVGDTGSGKSSIVQLLMRFYDPESGRVLIDGVDAREFSLKSLRALFALVSQDTMLFNETIRYNLIYGLERPVSEEELWQVCRKARLEPFIKALPNQWDTVIGDRGVLLSGGERQRLSIARAILKKPEVFIFDEATSALDVHTEKMIHDAIREAIGDKTAILIAHRISTLESADTIVVLEGGAVIEEGSHASLLEKKGKFRAYWDRAHGII